MATAMQLHKTISEYANGAQMRTREGLWFDVQVLDARQRWGVIDVLVTTPATATPVWVESTRVLPVQ